MAIITLTIIAMVLTPAFTFSDSVIGTKASLSDAGITRSVPEPAMTLLENMDIPQQDWSGEEEEENSGEEKPGNQFVIKGHPSYPAMFQHQAAIIVNTSYGYFQICGAVLVDERHAITAAHCTRYFFANFSLPYFIAVGIHNRSMGLLNPGSQMVAVDNIIEHPKFDDSKPGIPHDISVIHFASNITENSYVQFAELATPADGDFAYHLCSVSGWGFTEYGRPDILQFGYQYIPTIDDCRRFWAIIGDTGIAKKRHICGYYYPTSGCFGDSGGPLTCGNVVAGLVSWGLSSCSGCFPTVYTRVSSHYHWIQKKIA